MVNIAVFAAFRFVIARVLGGGVEFKRVCRDRPLDIWCYGWQKRQDRGKNGKVRGTVSTDSGTILTDSGTMLRVQPAVARGG
jgi:hypothetical protein